MKEIFISEKDIPKTGVYAVSVDNKEEIRFGKALDIVSDLIEQESEKSK